jgi:hypothetical protein
MLNGRKDNECATSDNIAYTARFAHPNPALFMLVKRNTLNDHLRVLSKYGIKIGQKYWASFIRKTLGETTD